MNDEVRRFSVFSAQRFLVPTLPRGDAFGSHCVGAEYQSHVLSLGAGSDAERPIQVFSRRAWEQDKQDKSPQKSDHPGCSVIR
jgi:hypothetical protein